MCLPTFPQICRQKFSFAKVTPVYFDDPAKWAESIEAVRVRHRMRLEEIKALKASYGEMYSWKEQCEEFVQRMWKKVNGKRCCCETHKTRVYGHEKYLLNAIDCCEETAIRLEKMRN